jgi:hypothetical protein
MKVQVIIVLFLAISLFFAADCTFLMFPAVSSVSLPLNSGCAAGQSAPDPVVVENYPSNITISGNLNITGDSVVNLAGVSSSNLVNVYLYGSIFINDNATLVLKYANLYFMGATKPYGCNITMVNPPNGHPHLDIGPAVVIDAYTSASIKIGSKRVHGVNIPIYATVSYGAAIYAYNNSEISADGLNFYRQATYNYSLGGPTLIECLGDSSATLTNVRVDSVLTYSAANVTIYTGIGTYLVGKVVNGIRFGCYNTSVTDLYDVSFQSIVASDEAHLLLVHCSEIGGSITAMGLSRVDFTDGTLLNPVINATGNSYVSLSSSSLPAPAYNATMVFLNEDATFAILNESTVTGLIFAFDNSSLVMNDSGAAAALNSIGIVGLDSSSVSIFKSTLSSFPTPVTLSFFDDSKLSAVDSTISGALISFFNNATAYISNSQLSSAGSGLRIASQDNASMTVIGSTITAGSMELSDDASLSVKSSTILVISCINSSQVSVGQGSIVSELSASDSARVQVYNSTLFELSLTEQSVNGSLSGLTGFVKNSTIALSGSTLNVSLLNAKVSVGFTFLGLSNVTISNSTLSNLILLGSSVVTLNNASVSSSPYVRGNSRVSIYSALRVRCVDYFGNPLNGSIVTVIGCPGVTPTEITDKNGLASFVVFSEMDNATANFPLGTVTVTGSFGGVSTSQDISLASMSKEVTLSFPLPPWSSYFLPLVILIGIVVLLIAIYYVVKRIRGNREAPVP